MLPTRQFIRSGIKTLRISSTSGIFKRPLTTTPCILNRRNNESQKQSLSSSAVHNQRKTAHQKAQKASFSTATAQETVDSTIFCEVTPVNDGPMIEVKWADGNSTKYPYVWLRDNCHCPNCFHSLSNSRRVLLKDLDINVTPVSMKLNDANDELEIDWSDGHKGLYPGFWLQDRSFTESRRAKRQEIHRFNRTYWGAEMLERLPKVNFNDLIEDDLSRLNFLQKLEELGLVIVENTPCRVGQLEKLSEHVGFLKMTHYGLTFNVQSKADPSNLAYTADSLNLHVDLPYLVYKPGVQLLHCISQATGNGGENHLVDGFNAALQLRDRHPEKFDILATTPLDFNDQGIDNGYRFHAHSQDSMIVIDRYGLINTINFNQMTRDSYFDITVDKVHDWYDAMLTYYNLLYHPDNLITYKLNAGDIVVFDNNRVLHGRNGYKITDGTRELEGGYWDWDVVKSCRRTLMAKLAETQ